MYMAGGDRTEAYLRRGGRVVMALRSGLPNEVDWGLHMALARTEMPQPGAGVPMCLHLCVCACMCACASYLSGGDTADFLLVEHADLLEAMLDVVAPFSGLALDRPPPLTDTLAQRACLPTRTMTCCNSRRLTRGTGSRRGHVCGLVAAGAACWRGGGRTASGAGPVGRPARRLCQWPAGCHHGRVVLARQTHTHTHMRIHTDEQKVTAFSLFLCGWLGRVEAVVDVLNNLSFSSANVAAMAAHAGVVRFVQQCLRLEPSTAHIGVRTSAIAILTNCAAHLHLEVYARPCRTDAVAHAFLRD
jgi:hypothetical protein